MTSPVRIKRLDELAATRGGRVALKGFEYQRAFAVWRLAAMMLKQALPGCDDVPVWIRYEWAEDIDELTEDGRMILWQCKHGEDWSTPSKLAGLLAGFAPKWLWTAPSEQSRLCFRLATSDRKYSGNHDTPAALPSIKTQTRTEFEKLFASKPSDKSDLALWYREVPTVKSRDALFNALWKACTVLYVPADLSRDPQGIAWDAEQRAATALCNSGVLAVEDRGNAVLKLQSLLSVATPEPLDAGHLRRPKTEPSEIRWLELRSSLASFAPLPRKARLQIRDRTDMLALLGQPLGPAYVARRPEWADVVRGPDPHLKFFERTVTDLVHSSLREALEICQRQPGKLRIQWVLGSPGSGKSTLALRVAAKLLLEGCCIAVDARHAFNTAESIQDWSDALLNLAEQSLPVLLLLDDPLGTESGWPTVLSMLSRSAPAIVVLAASPTFLWEHHKHKLRDVAPLPLLRLPQPDTQERKALLSLYAKEDSPALDPPQEELLVMAMQAATGMTFDEIIQGIWNTLGDGRETPASALNTELTWGQAAYALVVYFDRAYSACPVTLVEALLALRSSSERLHLMREFSGWSIFQISTADTRWPSQGEVIRSMHASVARRAWELRPAMGWNLVPEIASWSVTPATNGRTLAKAITDMALFAQQDANRLLEAIEQAWSMPEADGILSTRQLVEFATVIQLDGRKSSGTFIEALRRRVLAENDQSWLALLQIQQVFPSAPVDKHLLGTLIDAGDFFLAPYRAVLFGSQLVRPAKLDDRFLSKLWTAFDNATHNDGIPAHVLAWLLSQQGTGNVEIRLPRIRQWVDSSASTQKARSSFLSWLSRHPEQCTDDDLQSAIQYLQHNPSAGPLRSSLIRLLAKLDDKRLASVLAQTLQSLESAGDEAFLPASAALSATRSLEPDNLDLIARWLEWATAVLDRSHGATDPDLIAGALGHAIKAAKAQLAKSPTKAATRASESVDRAIQARANWKRSKPNAIAPSAAKKPQA